MFPISAAVPSIGILLAVVPLLALMNAAGGATVIIARASIFPVEIRSTAVSLVYALGLARCGCKILD